ncbi:hypothetical protein GGF46_001288 [Coemansia sp. RSA 552]|nr:hypothetical protein GGF46_001288 [Coemansia sp. RSA 552]
MARAASSDKRPANCSKAKRAPRKGPMQRPPTHPQRPACTSNNNSSTTAQDIAQLAGNLTADQALRVERHEKLLARQQSMLERMGNNLEQQRQASAQIGPALKAQAAAQIEMIRQLEGLRGDIKELSGMIWATLPSQGKRCSNTQPTSTLVRRSGWLVQPGQFILYKAPDISAD